MSTIMNFFVTNTLSGVFISFQVINNFNIQQNQKPYFIVTAS